MEALQTEIAAKDKKIKDLQQALITIAKHSSPELFNEAKKATETQLRQHLDRIGQLEREKDGLHRDLSSTQARLETALSDCKGLESERKKQATLATNHAKTIASLQAEVAPLPRILAAVEAWKTAVQACETGLKATIAQRDTVTKERDDALARIDYLNRNVCEARAELETQRATTVALTKDRDDALERLESADARGEMLMGELAESQQLRRDISRELNDATRQYDEAVAARDKVLNERDEALSQRDAAVLHRDNAVRERETMVAALDELKRSANARSDAAADLRRQVKNLSRNNQASALTLDQVRKDLEKAVTHRDTAISERNELRAQCGRLVAQRDAVHTNYVALRREIQDHHCHFTSTHTLLNPVPITKWEATLRAVGEERDAVLTLAKQQFDTSIKLKADLLLALQRAENLKCERDELQSRITVLRRERDGRSSTAENSTELACTDGTREAVRGLLDAIITGVGATEASSGHLAYMKTLHGDLLDALHDERKRNAELSSKLDELRPKSEIHAILVRGVSNIAERLQGVAVIPASAQPAKPVDPAFVEGFTARLRAVQEQLAKGKAWMEQATELESHDVEDEPCVQSSSSPPALVVSSPRSCSYSSSSSSSSSDTPLACLKRPLEFMPSVAESEGPLKRPRLLLELGSSAS